MKTKARAHAVALGLVVLAGCSGGGAAPGGPPPGGTPSPVSSATPAPPITPTPLPSGTSNASGTVNIPVPTPAPVTCSPAPVTVALNQNVALACSASGYRGAFAFSIGDPTIANVSSGDPSNAFLSVYGLKAGTTTLTLTYPPGGSGTVAITVTP